MLKNSKRSPFCPTSVPASRLFSDEATNIVSPKKEFFSILLDCDYPNSVILLVTRHLSLVTALGRFVIFEVSKLVHLLAGHNR